jgi:hypothetical protein
VKELSIQCNYGHPLLPKLVVARARTYVHMNTNHRLLCSVVQYCAPQRSDLIRSYCLYEGKNEMRIQISDITTKENQPNSTESSEMCFIRTLNVCLCRVARGRHAPFVILVNF